MNLADRIINRKKEILKDYLIYIKGIVGDIIKPIDLKDGLLTDEFLTNNKELPNIDLVIIKTVTK